MHTLNYVKKGQILMCRFEDCWNNAESCICTDKSIIANIKPEIGKIRPVVIIHARKHNRTAVVIPFTTVNPQNKNFYTVFIPKGMMPGILAKKACWALCNMPKTVSLDRLQPPFCGKKNLLVNLKTLKLENDKFMEICSVAKTIF